MKKDFGRDPLRALMMAVPQGRGAGALCTALCALFAAAAYALLRETQGAAAIALCGAAGLALLLWGVSQALRGTKEPALVWLFAAAACMLAVAAHLAMLDIKPGRYTKVLAPLFEDMWNYEMITALAWEDDGWSGVYLIVCALISRLQTFSQLYAVKLFDMICQCLCGVAVVRLAKRRGAGVLSCLGGMLACVLAPTMLMNAGCWAQCDATFAMLTLWGLALLLEETERGVPAHSLAGCVLWGLALGTKLQSAFLFPLLIVLFMNRRVSLRHLLALVGTYLLSQSAILIDGQGLAAVLARYSQQLANARGSIGLSDHAPGVYALMKVASVREFSGMGLYLGIACALIVVWALLRRGRPLDDEALLLAALLLAAGLPLVLPQMNARSLYLAGMLAFALADTPKRLAVAAALEVVSLCSYMEAVFGLTIMPMSTLSLIAIAAATVTALELSQKLKATNAA